MIVIQMSTLGSNPNYKFSDDSILENFSQIQESISEHF